MKYRINELDEMEFDVIVEDGGVVSVHHNGENLVSTYYQNRITQEMDPEDFWDELGSGEAYMKDWPDGTHRDAIIQAALDWLVLPAPAEWVLDKSIWKDFS